MPPTFERAPIETPKQEIEKFNSSIQETMDRIYGRSFEDTPASIQQDVVKQVIEKHVEDIKVEPISNPFPQKVAKAEKIILDLSPDDDDAKMGHLLGLIHDMGLTNTLRVIEKTESYHIKDDLHRVLVQYLKTGHEVKGLKENMPEAQGLSMTLFEIYLPKKEDQAENTKDLKTLLSSMEQFYAGMRSVTDPEHPQNYFSVEIALPQGRDEIVFYTAVPHAKATILRSQLIAIFPGIKIIESNDDYNIFNKKEHIAASVAELSKIDLLPIKSYNDFDYDPLNIILESFSSLDREEGASVQIMLQPDEKVRERIYKGIENLEKGEEVKDALTMKESLWKNVSKSLDDAFSTKTEEEKAKEKEKKREIAARTDRKELIEQLQTKNKGQIYKANLRIVAAGNSESHAQSILSGIESSFNQFENTLGNRFVFERLKKKKLKDLIQDFTFRIYDPKHAMHLSTVELTTIIHFHAKPESGTDILKTTQSQTSGASFKTVEQADHPSQIKTPGKVLLGVNRHQGTENRIFMSAKDRLRHMYVIGQTGTGKSILLQNMIIQDIINGDGCCFIDPHGSDIQDILANIPPERHKDVIYFDPADLSRPMGMNMLEYDPAFPEQKTFVVNELLSIFKKLYGDTPESMGPAFEQYFRNATMLVMEDPATGNTMLEISRVLSDSTFRALKLARCKNMVVKQFWEKIASQAGGDASLENIVPYITNKFDAFLANDFMRPIIAQEKSAFNLRDVMDNKKILLVNLSKGRLGDINSNLIGLIIVGKILMAALSRVTSFGEELPNFYLYIDEFQNITTNSISQILSEARKYGLSLNVAHQFIKQLDEGIRDAVFGNVGSMATFRISAEDAEFMEKYYSPQFDAKDIMSIENWNAYMKMLVNGSPEKPFNIATMAPRKGNPEQLAMLKKLSTETYGTPREEIEAIVNKKLSLL